MKSVDLPLSANHAQRNIHNLSDLKDIMNVEAEVNYSHRSKKEVSQDHSNI
jgi:hypothetical protein